MNIAYYIIIIIIIKIGNHLNITNTIHEETNANYTKYKKLKEKVKL